MDRLYTYYDYENAYYNMQYTKCIEIGKYILPYIHNDEAKKLLKKLNKAYYIWDMPEEELKELVKLLFDIKLWIMVNYY